MYVFVVIEHAHRRIQVLGATPHPTASWVTQAAKNLVMDLEDTGRRARFMIRDKDAKFSALFDNVLADAESRSCSAGPHATNELDHGTVVQTCRRELLDRTLIWNQTHLLHALPEFEQFYSDRPHQAIGNASPLPKPIADPAQTASFDIRRHQRRGGILHE